MPQEQEVEVRLTQSHNQTLQKDWERHQEEEGESTGVSKPRWWLSQEIAPIRPVRTHTVIERQPRPDAQNTTLLHDISQQYCGGLDSG